MKYGYIAPDSLKSDGDTARLQSFPDALIELQKFLGLEETGKFDPMTIAMMQKPRCGNPDKVKKNIFLNFLFKLLLNLLAMPWCCPNRFS